MTDHRFGGTAQEHSLEPTPAVSSDHDEIGSDSVARVEDGLRRGSDQHRELGAKPEPL